MGARRRLTVAIALSLIAPACKDDKPAPAPTPRPAAAADRLSEGELPEGQERAFSLPLPLHSTVKARFPRSVHVASPHTREELTRFVRERVQGGKTSSDANEVRFDNVTATRDPSRALSIRIRAAPLSGEYKSQLVIDDVTVTPEELGETETERWRKAGLSPDGKLLDRKHLE